MELSEVVMLMAQRFPFLFRSLLELSVRGYLPPMHRHWLFQSIARQLFEEDGLPVWRTPYKLSVPRDLLPIYLEYSNFLDYEPLTRRVFLASLKPGFVVIDVGANIGWYTLLAASAVGPEGRVHAVECAPQNLSLLEYNVRKNKLHHVRIHPYAAGLARGTQTLNVSPVGLAGFSPCSRWPTIPGSGTTVTVPVVPLDEVIGVPVHLVKIDVDGFDLQVLKGMKRIVSANKELAVIVEWAAPMLSNAGADPFELPAWLQDAGFRKVVVLDEYYKRRRSLDETARLLAERRLPPDWVCNLFASRRFSAS